FKGVLEAPQRRRVSTLTIPVDFTVSYISYLFRWNSLGPVSLRSPPSFATRFCVTVRCLSHGSWNKHSITPSTGITADPAHESGERVISTPTSVQEQLSDKF